MRAAGLEGKAHVENSLQLSSWGLQLKKETQPKNHTTTKIQN